MPTLYLPISLSFDLPNSFLFNPTLPDDRGVVRQPGELQRDHLISEIEFLLKTRFPQFSGIEVEGKHLLASFHLDGAIRFLVENADQIAFAYALVRQNFSAIFDDFETAIQTVFRGNARDISLGLGTLNEEEPSERKKDPVWGIIHTWRLPTGVSQGTDPGLLRSEVSVPPLAETDRVQTSKPNNWAKFAAGLVSNLALLVIAVWFVYLQDVRNQKLEQRLIDALDAKAVMAPPQLNNEVVIQLPSAPSVTIEKTVPCSNNGVRIFKNGREVSC